MKENKKLTSKESHINNQRSISVSFDLNTAITESESCLNLENLSEKDRIADNISSIIQKTIFDSLKTNVSKLEDAISKGSEDDFVQSLSHYKEDDEQIRHEIYSLVEQSLEQKLWHKSYLKILIRTGILAEHSGDLQTARLYFKRALKLEIDRETYVSIHLSYANCYAKENKDDAAIQIYQTLLESDLKDVSLGNIAWCHHNLGSSLIKKINISGAEFHFRAAAKIRAANKEKGEPFRTLILLAKNLELLDSQVSLSIYDEITSSLEDNLSLNDVIRTKAYAHLGAASIRCLELQIYEKALMDIDQAITLLKSFVEDRDSLASALYIKNICLQKLGRFTEAEKVVEKRQQMLDLLPNLESSLLNEENLKTDNSCLQRRFDVIKNLEKLSSIDECDLLFFIEEQIEILEGDISSSSKMAQSHLLNFYGEYLIHEDKFSLAIGYLIRAKALYPSFIKNNINLSYALYKNQNYSDAVESSLEIIKKHPTIAEAFYIAGLSAYKIADYYLAEQMLEDALELDDSLNKIAEYLHNTKMAIKDQKLRGVQQISIYQTNIYPKTHDRFLDYLYGFKLRCQKNSDAFWKSYSQQKFVQNPENLGRSLLVQDLQAQIQSANVYKEVILAGGRIDLIVNVLGSEFIIELKMCGNGYSSTYAEGGFEQLKSYMDVRDAKRAYLVVFDSRANQSNEQSLPKEHDLGDGRIIFCIGIDIKSMK